MSTKKKNIICSLLDHNYAYNKTGNLRICKRCKQKEVYMGIENFWSITDTFSLIETKNDQETIKEWKDNPVNPKNY